MRKWSPLLLLLPLLLPARQGEQITLNENAMREKCHYLQCGGRGGRKRTYRVGEGADEGGRRREK